MARQNFCLKSLLCKAICLFVFLGGIPAYAEDPPVYVMQFGTKGTGNGQFEGAAGVAVDSSGNIWVSDYGNHRVQKFNSSGVYQSQFGTFGTGNGQFNNPIGITVDSSGNIYVGDLRNERIQKFSGSGAYLSQIGTSGGGDGQFYGPIDLEVDKSGNIWVLDSGNNRVQKFSSTGTYISKFGSRGEGGKGQFDWPWGIAVDSSGNIWVADTYNSLIQKFNSSGVYQIQFGEYGSGNGQLIYPKGIAVDSSGNVWVADTENQRIQKFSSSGTYLSQFGTAGTGNGQFNVNSPSNIFIDNSNNIYVVDGGNNRIQKFAYSGSGVTRTLPSCYSPGTKLTVTLKAAPASTTGSYAVEETPPAGWTVSNISNDGTLYSGVIKFGPFYDNTSRTLTYDVTPPAAETGDKIFSGTASEDGVSKSIAGQTVISASLYHPADVNKDLLISMDEMTAYGAAWKKGTVWSIAPNPIPVDYVIRAATLWKKGGKYKIDCTAGTCPLCWVSVSKRSAFREGESSAVRDLPESYKAGEAFTVSVEVTPDSAVTAYGIEEQIPLGWTASEMNEGGSFDAAAFKVKFGPFITNQAKTLTYQVTPLTDAKGAYTFGGTASFDGNNPQITGDISVTDILPGDLNGDLKADLKDAVIALQIAAATQPPPTAALAGDVNSDGKIGTQEAVFALEKVAK